MSDCPSCGHSNIEGAESCEQCHQPLTDLHLPSPASAVEKSLLKDRVAELDPKAPVTVSKSTSAQEVLQTMVDRQIGCVLVVDGQDLVGIFTERDAVKRLGTKARELGTEPISKFMTPTPETLGGGVKVAFAVQRMDLGGFRHVPIIDDSNRPIGVVSVRDILRYLTEKTSA